MEAQTIQKFIHTSPRKLRLVADMVRRMPPAKAMEVLSITNKAAARDLLKSIETVMANAKQKGLDTESASFQRIEINEASKMKRYRASTRGRVKPYAKKMSHIKIVISDELLVGSGGQKKNKNSRKEAAVGDSAEKSKSAEKGKTESSK